MVIIGLGDVPDDGEDYVPFSICNDGSRDGTPQFPTNLSDDEDFERSYTFLTPNGTKVWCPISESEAKPIVGVIYGSWNDAINMYKNYAEKLGFYVRVGQTKKNKE
ncbi:hypothetical protein R6Q59_028274 [Mikania micrantha]